MRGIQVVEKKKEPQYTLPQNWEGMKICLKWTGGVGDVLMAIGGTAPLLKKKKCEVVACVMPHQVELMKHLEGVDSVLGATDTNHSHIRNSFDVIIDFSFSINCGRAIKKGCYYSLISDHINLSVVPGRFTFSRNPAPLFAGTPSVFIHPAASNPNRRWEDAKWKEIAYTIRDWGYHVVWLGTQDEFGFNDEQITKLSDESADLLWQVKQIANHATYFIGCDSGFAHVCGLLGTPGAVLFFATEPSAVIGKYPNLLGLHCFDSLGVTPTLSLRTDDAVSKKCSALLSVNDILESCGIPIMRARQMAPNESTPNRLSLAIYGNTPQADNLASFLAHGYTVEILEELPHNGTVFDVLIVVADDQVTITTRNGLTVRVNADHPENVKRAIRELIGRTSDRDN